MQPASHTAWPDTPLRERLAWVRRFRAALVDHADDLVRSTARDTHKPEHEALTADLLPLLAACRWCERRAARVLRDRPLPGARPLWMLGTSSRLRRAPVGRVAIIATWNYPVQLLGVQLLQALVAGNTVRVKPSEHAGPTQNLLLDLAVAAGLPDDTLTRTPATRDAGRTLLADDALDHVVFTGSTSVGRAIAETLAPRLIPSTLELSGRDSAFVLADADPALAARVIWNAAISNGGQTCMAPRRALVDERVLARFLRELAPLAASTRPRRLITPDAADRCFALATDAARAGARSLSGVFEPPGGPLIRPLAIADCPADAELVAGDHFGPVLPVVPVASVDEALAIHRACDQHLATSVFTRDRAAARALAPALGASHVTINDCIVPTAHPGAGLAGRRASGWGISRGEAGLLALTRPVVVSRTSRRLRTPTDPPDRRGLDALRSVTRLLYNGSSPSGPGPAPSPHRASAGGPEPKHPGEPRPARPAPAPRPEHEQTTAP